MNTNLTLSKKYNEMSIFRLNFLKTGEGNAERKKVGGLGEDVTRLMISVWQTQIVSISIHSCKCPLQFLF